MIFFSFYLNDPAGQSCHLVLNAGFLALSAFFLSLALTANTRLPGSLRHGDSEWRDVNVTYTAAACLTHDANMFLEWLKNIIPSKGNVFLR